MHNTLQAQGISWMVGAEPNWYRGGTLVYTSYTSYTIHDAYGTHAER